MSIQRASLLPSATVELLQLTVVTGRVVDVDDVILNTTGGVIGGAAFIGFAHVWGLLARDRMPVDASTRLR